jgi:hypothetical protein
VERPIGKHCSAKGAGNFVVSIQPCPALGNAGGQDVDAVLGGGGQVAADRVPLAGGFFGAEPAGDLLLGFGWAQVAFGLVGGGRDRQVVDEPQHVVLPVAEAFEQVAAGVLLAAWAAGDLG